MLEKTLEFAEKAPVFNPELCNSIKKLYASTLDTEIERAESKRESRSYIKSLEKKREELSFEQITSVAEPPERKDRVFDSRSIANGNVDLPEKVSEEDEEPIASDVSPKLRLAQILFPVLTIAGGIALIFFGVQIMNRKPAEEVVAKVANTEPEQKVETTETPSESEQAESQVEKKDSETVQKLDAVSERLGILKSLKKVANNMEAEIDTAALEKSAELRNEPPPKQPESRTPSLDPNHFKTKSRQELNSGSPFGSKKITEGQDGRRYGPGPSKKAGLRGPDGKPVEPQEVQQFDEPRPYETLNGTEVFSAPSLRAVSLARLEKGAVVHVVSKMGMWLELRSTGGRKGYIYSQDADPVEALN